MMKEFCLRIVSGVTSPTTHPCSTRQYFGSPSQPLSVLPSKIGSKPDSSPLAGTGYDWAGRLGCCPVAGCCWPACGATQIRDAMRSDIFSIVSINVSFLHLEAKFENLKRIFPCHFFEGGGLGVLFEERQSFSGDALAAQPGCRRVVRLTDSASFAVLTRAIAAKEQ